MSLGMFRGKESSNRIELSRLVQDLLNFAVLGSLQLWGGGRWVGGVWGHVEAWGVSSHACTCMHMHTHTHMHMYTCIEIANGCQHGGIHVDHVYHVQHACACVCMRMHASVHGTPFHTPISTPTTSTRPYPHPPIHHPPGG